MSVRVADDEGHRHGFAKRAAEAEHDAADDADARIGDDDVARSLPRSCSRCRRRTPSAPAARSRTRRAMIGGDERQHHDGEDQAAVSRPMP